MYVTRAMERRPFTVTNSASVHPDSGSMTIQLRPSSVTTS
jgi:hypothetical protein